MIYGDQKYLFSVEEEICGRTVLSGVFYNLDEIVDTYNKCETRIEVGIWNNGSLIKSKTFVIKGSFKENIKKWVYDVIYSNYIILRRLDKYEC